MKRKHQAVSILIAAVICLGSIPMAYALEFNHRNTVLSGGMSHTLAVQQNGTVWSWGSNDAGQLGVITDGRELDTPRQVPGISSAISVAAGSNFSAALLRNGLIMAWGAGSTSVEAVPGLSDVSAISAGQNVLLALKSDGSVWQWSAGEGESAYQVTGLPGNISAVSTGGGHFLALTRTGDVWAWGRNDVGQLGLGMEDKQIHTVPQKIPSLFDIVDIAAGFSHSLALDFDGRIYAWGANNSGQLGNRSTNKSSVPVQVSLHTNQIMITAGMDASMCMSPDGVVRTWGIGKYGQLGGGSESLYSDFPQPLETLEGTIVFIASGHHHCLAITDKGDVYAWGQAGGTAPFDSKELKPQLKISLGGNMEGYTPGTYPLPPITGLNSWAETEVQDLYNLEIVSPMMWQDFQSPITRAEFAHLMVDVHEKVAFSLSNSGTSSTFTDITNHRLKWDIIAANQLGLIGGRSATVFAPDENVTRQEAAKMLCSLVSKVESIWIPTHNLSVSYYRDADKIASWAVRYVAFAHDNGIMQGNNGNFDPAGNMTREQSLQIIDRLIQSYGWQKK